MTVVLTEDQSRKRDQYRNTIKAMDDYYAPYRERWRNNGAIFNLIQQGTDDVTSNWYMGWARILINHAMAMMTAGNPIGSFKPFGNNDYKMEILVSSLVEYYVNRCNWNAHQRLWIQDILTFGNGVTDSYSDTPMKSIKVMRGEKVVNRIVQDLRRSKVGIRRKSPFRAMRSHFISDPDDVPFSTDTEEGTWDQLILRYDNVFTQNGTKKYDLSQLPVGSHYRIVKIYNETGNCMHMYCTTYGGKPESTVEKCPPIWDLGYPIYEDAMSHYKFTENGKTEIRGLNSAGMSPLAFATYEDQLDADMETYATIGMGIPQIIAGPEAVMHGLVNMSIDNERLRSTVPISYEPNSQDSPSALSLDIRDMYSGLVIDGKITPQPLGLSSAGSNQVMWDWLKFIIYQLTGINPEPLTGDSLSTAYQSGLLVRQMNMRAKAKIAAWQSGPLNRAWTVLGANALSRVTVEEWEEITEDDAKRIQEAIKADEMTAEDYQEEMDEGVIVHKKRVHTYIPVKGYKLREDFTGKNKKRTLNAKNIQDNTLIEDPDMQGDTSHVIASEKYLFPSGAVETVFRYQVGVDASGMLQDLKTQDVEMYKNAIGNAQVIANLKPNDPSFINSLDQKKMFIASIEPTGLTEEDVFVNQTDASAVHTAFKDAVDQLNKENSISSPQDNAAQNPTNPAQPIPSQSPASASASGQAGEVTGQPIANPALQAFAR